MTPGQRGQTQIDFLIGMSVFLMAVAFTFGFVPTMTQPFEDTSGSDLQVADRSAAHLAEYALGTDSDDDAPEQPAVIDRSCTEQFFDESKTEPSNDCRWTNGSADLAGLQTELGLDSTTSVNVTITAEEFRAGPTLPDGANVAVSNRVVSIDGDVRKLYVRVW